MYTNYTASRIDVGNTIGPQPKDCGDNYAENYHEHY